MEVYEFFIPLTSNMPIFLNAMERQKLVTCPQQRKETMRKCLDQWCHNHKVNAFNIIDYKVIKWDIDILIQREA